jgi:hypothetical protein
MLQQDMVKGTAAAEQQQHGPTFLRAVGGDLPQRLACQRHFNCVIIPLEHELPGPAVQEDLQEQHQGASRDNRAGRIRFEK